MGGGRDVHRVSRHVGTRPVARVIRAAALLAGVAVMLGGCAGRENEADEAARAALTFDTETPAETPAVRTAPAVAPLPDAAGIAPPLREDAAPVGQWFVQDGPVAAWGVPNSEAVLSFACDGAGGDVVMTREAIGVSAEVGVITLDADGLRRCLPAVRKVTELGPQLIARIPVRDPLLDRLRTATRLRVQAGGDTLLTSAPGAALARVLDACRADRASTPSPSR
jgi:hypothetical protein